jgi:carbon-monoxide dehydrogenase medium subunit
MRIPKFEYIRPLTVEDTCSLLYKYKTDAKLLAGGTDLFVKMKKKQILPKVVISLNGIQKLDRIEWNEKEGLTIGPLGKHEAIVHHPIVKEKFDFLSEACFKIGTRQVRQMGTLVGNLCNASPSSDAAAPLLALDTKIKLVHLYGDRVVPLEEFFVGPFQTVLHPEEIVVEIRIPKPAPHSAGSYQYIHKASSVGETLVGVAVLLTVNPRDLICQEARVGLCSVAPTPIRAKAAERFLKDKKVDAKTTKQAAQMVSDEIQPRSRPWYRREMAKILAERAILQAMEKIG